MALITSVAVTQTTNGTILDVDDNTGTYDVGDNPGGWGVPNDTYDSISAGTITVWLYTTASTYTTYDAINIYDGDGSTGTNIEDAASIADFVWEIKAQDLKESGTSPYADDQILPDGVYKVIYALTGDTDGAVSYSTTFLLNFNVKSDVFETFRLLTDNYQADICSDCDIRVAEKQWTFLEALEKASICGNITNIINTLDYLERVIAENSTYGCSCT